jgi:four helix bundle protein
MDRKKLRSHKDLQVWQKSIELVTLLYAITEQFPGEERFGLTNQMRRVAVSIPSNIAEGAARNHNKEFIQFLHVALGSAAELETQLIISENLSFLSAEKSSEVLDKLSEIRNMLLGLIHYLKNK